MKEEVIKFLSQFKELDTEQIQELAKHLNVKEFKKNETIVKQGEACNLCYFVLKGCLRQYVLTDGAEKTVGIYTEQQAVNFYSNQKENSKALSYLSCVEKSIVMIGNPETDVKIFSQFPVLLNITRNMLESEMGETQLALAKFISSSPEERYLNFLNERPHLLQRVPLHIIASYLGMTPESLSRIRRRINSIKKTN